MQPYLSNIEDLTNSNEYFRHVLYTAKHCQLVVMSLKPGEEIGNEVHHLDQFFRFEKGHGKAVVAGKEHEIKDGTALIVPSGTEHNIINTSPDQPLKLYTIYCPPNHQHGTIHATKAEAEKDDEHFDGNLGQ